MRPNKKTPKKKGDEAPARPDIAAHPQFHGFGKTDMQAPKVIPTGGPIKKVKF